MWDEEVIPQQLKEVSIIRLYKKGNRQLCDKYRGISLLVIAGKSLARVLLNHLIVHLKHGLLPDSQCGFRGGRGNLDMIFAARQLQEKCQEQYDDIFITFIDLTNAFDIVYRDGLCQIIETFGCQRKFTALVRQLHDGMRVTVIDNGDTSGSFPVTNGVKQSCVLAATLFNMVFAATLHDASQHNDDGIQLRYRTDGGVLVLPSAPRRQVMHQPAPRTMYHEPHIFVNDEPLKYTDSFTYLGSTLSREANIDVEVNNRLSKANSALWRLKEESVGPTRNQARDQAEGIHGCPTICIRESWIVYSRHARKLNHFHTKCLRIILSIKWQDMVPDTPHEQAFLAFTLYCRKPK